MVTLTPKELAEMQEDIDNGRLPKNAIKEHYQKEAIAVFGFDASKDRKGNFVQQGIGSKGHETGNHFAAIRRYHGEAAYFEALAEIWKRDPKRAEALDLPRPVKAAS